MCVNNLAKVTLDSAAAGIEPGISNRKYNGPATTPPSHANYITAINVVKHSNFGPTVCLSLWKPSYIQSCTVGQLCGEGLLGFHKEAI